MLVLRQRLRRGSLSSRRRRCRCRQPLVLPRQLHRKLSYRFHLRLYLQLHLYLILQLYQYLIMILCLLLLLRVATSFPKWAHPTHRRRHCL